MLIKRLLQLGWFARLIFIGRREAGLLYIQPGREGGGGGCITRPGERRATKNAGNQFKFVLIQWCFKTCHPLVGWRWCLDAERLRRVSCIHLSGSPVCK